MLFQARVTRVGTFQGSEVDRTSGVGVGGCASAVTEFAWRHATDYRLNQQRAVLSAAVEHVHYTSFTKSAYFEGN